MRATAVPAQVTTVEDRIMGNLGFSQLVLFILPIFVGAGLFVILPPMLHGSLYKYTVIVVLAMTSCVLAIRFKGRIILLWLITILKYNIRPKYYVFQKSTTIYREEYKTQNAERSKEANEPPEKKVTQLPKLAFRDAVYVLETINKSESNLRFEMTKKGGLNVHFTKVKD